MDFLDKHFQLCLER